MVRVTKSELKARCATLSATNRQLADALHTLCKASNAQLGRGNILWLGGYLEIEGNESLAESIALIKFLEESK